MPITYKCPNCGAAMEFDSTAQKLKCPSCQMEMDVQDYEKQYGHLYSDAEAGENAQSAQSAQSEGQKGKGSMNMKVYHCQSCGAELLADEYTSATICSFCGNPSLVEDRLSGEFSPSSVIPFQIDREAAKKMYKSWVKKGLLTPKTLSTESTIEKISGVYVPFWMFDCKANADITYRGEKTTAWSDSENDYVKTDHYKIFRAGTLDFENLPVDASKKADDSYMDALEPYNLGEAVKFDTAYLAGFLADKYDISASDSEPRANERIKNSTEQTFAGTVDGFSGVVAEKSKVNFSNGKVRYSMLPVWMLHIAYAGQNYAYAINGQTGKVVGSFPISKKKRNLYFLKAFGIGVAVMAAVLALITLL